MFKRFMRSKAVQKILGFILAAYMVLIKHTTRWTVEGQEIVQPHIDTGTGAVVLTWHSRLLMLHAIWKRGFPRPHILISLSRDGALVAYAAEFLGHKTIRGSARKAGSQKIKGGSTALRGMISVIEKDGVIVVTPDGPRGPRQRLGNGPLGLAKLSGAPIVSTTFAVRNRIQFKSWDRFVLPLPFGRGLIIWGTPLTIPADCSDEDLETYKQQLEDEMNANLKQADTRLGRSPSEPAKVKS